jgi:hypothetical protein
VNEDILDGENMVAGALDRGALILGRRDDEIDLSIATPSTDEVRLSLVLEHPHIKPGIDEAGNKTLIPNKEIVNVCGRALLGRVRRRSYTPRSLSSLRPAVGEAC